MLRNYLMVGLRTLRRAKLYSTINIMGLAVGLAVAILIGLWLKNELSYDKYNANADRIYRVTTHFKMADFSQTMATSAPPIASVLRSLPSVLAATSLCVDKGKFVVRCEEKEFVENDLAYADSGFFSVFSLRLDEGIPSAALTAPNTVVLTKSFATLLFGKADPISKVISIYLGSKPEDFTVTGVMEDVPDNSHFHFKMLASLSTFYLANPSVPNGWFYNTNYNYFVLRPNATIGSVERQLTAAVRQNLGTAFVRQYSWGVGLQRLTDIHLFSHLSMEIEPNGNIRTVLIFLAIGLFVLFIAIVNFISLSTARYTDRAKEIGIRKVVGADRKRLIFQFTGEAVLLTFISTIVAVSLAEIALPFFNALTDRSLSISIWDLAAIVLGGLIVGVFAGSYPTFFLSSFAANRIFTKGTVLKRGGAAFRKGLVVTQFALAVAVIISTIVIARQLNYIENRDLGLNKDGVVVLPLYSQQLAEDYNPLKAELSACPGVTDVSGSWGELGNSDWQNELQYAGTTLFKCNWLGVDYNFIKALQIHMVSGRRFSANVAGDSSGAIIVNEVAANKLSALGLLDKPLKVAVNDIKPTSLHVIGVMNDFNYLSMYHPVQPFFLVLTPQNIGYIYVRISPQNIESTLVNLAAAWKKIVPEYPFEYHFLAKQLDRSYGSARRLGEVFGIAALLSIIISALGVFGLAGYTVERRTKEVGIRKALGASVGDIGILLTKEFAALVIIANLVAWPAAYYFMNRWLGDFSFRINLGVAPFLLAGAIALVIALLTVSFHAIKAATANPVESLRYE